MALVRVGCGIAASLQNRARQEQSRGVVMTATISERAAAAIKTPKPQRVACPNCEATFDLNKIGKPRSPEQHKRFWALMNAAYMHWPEGHNEQFSCMNDLRVWLTMKAGWRTEVARLPVIGMKIDLARALAEAAIRAAGTHARPVIYKDKIVIFAPKSIRFDRMNHLNFCSLNDAVADVIKSEMHITADELLSQTEKAA
jgi:hypothetical protein